MGRRRSAEKLRDAGGQHAGWWRPSPRTPWRKLAEGSSWRQAWLALVEAVGRRGGELTILVANVHPDEVPVLASATYRPGRSLTIEEGPADADE